MGGQLRRRGRRRRCARRRRSRRRRRGTCCGRRTCRRRRRRRRRRRSRRRHIARTRTVLKNTLQNVRRKGASATPDIDDLANFVFLLRHHMAQAIDTDLSGGLLQSAEQGSSIRSEGSRRLFGRCPCAATACHFLCMPRNSIKQIERNKFSRCVSAHMRFEHRRSYAVGVL